MKVFDGKINNYYLSKYNNFIKIGKKKTALYNSLSGKTILFNKDISIEQLHVEINNKENNCFFIENKFIYKNKYEEEKLLRSSTKSLNSMIPCSVGFSHLRSSRFSLKNS